jgi:hypothetical protein
VITEPSMLVISNRYCAIWHNQTEEQASHQHKTQRDIQWPAWSMDTWRKLRHKACIFELQSALSPGAPSYHMYSTFHVVAVAMLFIQCELWLTLASSCSSCFTAISSLVLNAAVSAGGESGSRLTAHVPCCNK